MNGGGIVMGSTNCLRMKLSKSMKGNVAMIRQEIEELSKGLTIV
jgi:hypothetical protein